MEAFELRMSWVPGKVENDRLCCVEKGAHRFHPVEGKHPVHMAPARAAVDNHVHVEAGLQEVNDWGVNANMRLNPTKN